MKENILQVHRDKMAFWTLLGVLLISACFYMYCINATIHNVVARQNMESDISRLTLAIGTQEFQYITLRNQITLPLAYSLGFRDAGVKTFIPKTSSGSLSYLSNKI